MATIFNRIDQQLNHLAPVADLVARLYLARIFFLSGLNKFQDWDTTMYLFQAEYHVPLLSPGLAAVLATGAELVLSAILALGLLTRVSASGLFVVNLMAVIAYYHVLKDSPVAIQDHLAWGIMLALVLATRVQLFTLDRFIQARTS